MNPDDQYDAYVAANPDACERCYEEGIVPARPGTHVVDGPYGKYVTCGLHGEDAPS